MGDILNKLLFKLTYNENSEKAYNQQLKSAETSVQQIQIMLKDFRTQRDKFIVGGKASDYYIYNSEQYITEWSNWIDKNNSLMEGEYVAKKNEMKNLWDGLTNINKIAIEMGRIPKFIEYYLKDKQEKLTNDQIKAFEKVKEEAQKYYEKMNSQTPANILAKRDELNNKFGVQLKGLEDSVKSPNDPKSLLQGINDEFYNTFVEKVIKKEKVQENTFSVQRGIKTMKEYTLYFVGQSIQIFFGLLFAVFVANDFIGRPPYYRIFFFIFTFLIVAIYPFSFVIFIFYYIYRLVKGTSPVLYSILPLYPKDFGPEDTRTFFSLSFDLHKKDDYAIKEELNYFTSLAKAVGKSMDMEGLKKIAKESVKIKDA